VSRAGHKGEWRAEAVPGGGVKLVMPGVPPSLNAWSRWHWGRRKAYLDSLSSAVGALARAARIRRFEHAVVEVTYYFPDRRRRDKDNYGGKFLLDALCRAGVLADDCARLTGLPEPEFNCDRACPRTEVVIRPREPGAGEGERGCVL